jgi:pyruvate kinase
VHGSKLVFFDMGSIQALVKDVQRDRLECEIQNEGAIYENS